MVGPSIYYLLPILIAYTGGKMVYGVRGGVVGGFSVIGVIMATSDPLIIGDRPGSPMFLGAMIMGPLTAYVMKRIDGLWAGKIKPGFEMLVDNFSAGIWGAIMAVAGMYLLAPPLLWVIDRLGDAVQFLVDNSLLPLTSLFIEPAKVLFLNNAINHGVLTPLGIQEAAETGQSVLFLLEANPGPGLGPAAGVHVLRQGHGAGDRAGCGADPVLRRHPRGVLPLRADAASPDPGDDRRWHDGDLHQRAVRVRAARAGGTGVDLRGVRADRVGQLPGRHAVGDRRGHGRVRGGRLPAEDRQGRLG